MTKLHNIFSVPVFTTFLNGEVVEYLENLIIPKLDNLPFKKEENLRTDFYESEKIVTSKELKKFIEVVEPLCQEYSKKTQIKLLNNVKYWVQDYKQDQQFHSHAHPGAQISGVYYIRANNDAGELEFTNPNPHAYFQEYLTKTRLNHGYSITPTKGLLVLFPSYLFHRVVPSKNPLVERTCIAFNH